MKQEKMKPVLAWAVLDGFDASLLSHDGEALAIYYTKKNAKKDSLGRERIVKVVITEVK
jgi:hypothetical protein